MDSRGKEIKIEPEIDETRDEELLEGATSASAPAPAPAPSALSCPAKRKCIRHSHDQVQKLEEFYQECSHPNGLQQQDLGMRLGLETKQVKFWFQNRRTQSKVEKNHLEKVHLKKENEKLKAENIILRQAMANPVCNCCNHPLFHPELTLIEGELQHENARLQAEIERLRCVTSRFVQWSNSVWPNNNRTSFSIGSSSRPTIMPNRNPSWLNSEDFLRECANEVAQMACIGEPIWTKTSLEDIEMLNLDEYYKKFFPCGARNGPGIVHDASRATGLVSVDASFLVGELMNLDQWMEIFPSIVAAVSEEKGISSTDVQGTVNQTLPSLKAEFFQILSPLAPTRPVKFIRFCRQQDNNTWILLDVSPDVRSNHPNLQLGFTRFPSGFIIQSLSSHCSQVTVLEHWRYTENLIPHRFKTYLSSGLGFGAWRWLTALQRYGFSSSVPLPAHREPVHRELSPIGKVGLLSLSRRMVNAFCAGLFGLTNQGWNKLPARDTDRKIGIYTRKNQSEGNPSTQVSAISSIWIPIERNVAFVLLSDKKMLKIWAHLTHTSEMHELVRITKGNEPENRISVFAQGASCEENKIFVLQEMYNYAWGSLTVHAPIESSPVIAVMNGGDFSGIRLLPSGFTILPDCYAEATAGSSQKPREGCLLTIGIQIIINGSSPENLTEAAVKGIKRMVLGTIQKVKNALPVNLGRR